MSDVSVRVSGACGRITLNRPRAMNALTIEMVSAMQEILTSWANEPSVHFVLLDGAGERGLCAGGDIRALYTAIVAGNQAVAVEFFEAEYRLNYLIARYPKPYVALMDGIVMGGGIGVSAHASHRVVTERSELAMPETAIGFFPDVGATYLLGKAAGEFGTYLGLTGSRIGAADAISCRLADLMVFSESLAALTQEIESCDSSAQLEDCLSKYTTQAIPGTTREPRTWIGECFATLTVEEIFDALGRQTNTEANVALQALKKKSPTSLKVTLAALRNGRKLNDLAACLRQEFRIAQVCVRSHDFVEGVRAAIIDKDRQPAWRPHRLEEVTADDVQHYFADSGVGELDLAFDCLRVEPLEGKQS